MYVLDSFPMGVLSLRLRQVRLHMNALQWFSVFYSSIVFLNVILILKAQVFGSFSLLCRIDRLECLAWSFYP